MANSNVMSLRYSVDQAVLSFRASKASVGISILIKSRPMSLR
ncbi:MAG: hypothetical protein ACI4M5_03650 [Christensenellales bacterium]